MDTSITRYKSHFNYPLWNHLESSIFDILSIYILTSIYLYFISYLSRIAVEEENQMVVDEDQLKEQETGILELGNR